MLNRSIVALSVSVVFAVTALVVWALPEITDSHTLPLPGVLLVALLLGSVVTMGLSIHLAPGCSIRRRWMGIANWIAGSVIIGEFFWLATADPVDLLPDTLFPAAASIFAAWIAVATLAIILTRASQRRFEECQTVESA